MKKSELLSLNLLEASELLNKKEISSKELTTAYLENIEENDCKIGAYITVTSDLALQTAEKIDTMRVNGENLSPLAGIPFSVKDNICTKGIKTTCASEFLRDFTPVYDAHVIERLKNFGAVMLGKTNMDEFGMGSSNENSAFHITKNPRDFERVAGGSSGGSAASVAGKEALFSLGSDTGGSIRLPSSFCGAVGMKPTYGAVSRYGLVAFASSFDQIGVISRNAADNAAILDVISGWDCRDSTSSKQSLNLSCDITAEKLKIGIVREFFADGIDEDVLNCIQNAIEFYKKCGASIDYVSLPSIKSALWAYYIISSAEASSNLARFDGVRYGRRDENYSSIEELYKNSRTNGFGEEVKRRIMTGTFALSAGYYENYYKKAQRIREKIKSEFEEIFKKCDVIISPVCPTTAFKIGEYRDNPEQMYLSDIYTVPANLAGLPAISVPFGTDRDNLPVGIQLIGRPFGEAVLYKSASFLEKEACGDDI